MCALQPGCCLTVLAQWNFQLGLESSLPIGLQGNVKLAITVSGEMGESCHNPDLLH